MDVDDEIVEGTDDEEEDTTPADVLKRLQHAWMNERMSPDLLLHQTPIVECMMEQVRQMGRNLERVSKFDFRVGVHRMEIDRIKYIIASYLRCRLQKIELYHRYLLSSDSTKMLMSREELKFAQDYQLNKEKHFETLALNSFPSASGGRGGQLNPDDVIVKPNLDVHVFLKVNKESRGIMLNDPAGDTRTEEVDLTEDSQYLIRYAPVSKLVQNGDVRLI